MPIPTLFLAHGTPMHAIDDNIFTRDWQQLANGINPQAILVISAHWCTQGVRITGNLEPTTIHDFHGFPPALFAQQYPCPGSPALARDICNKLATFGALIDNNWGLDHGAWSVLLKLFPKADIPVVQLSLDLSLNAQSHIAIAQQLKGLNDQGVLIIGSGNIAHNIPKWICNPDGPIDWAVEFDKAVHQAVQGWDIEQLANYQQLPFAADAVPTAEHYLPLLYAMAAAPQNASVLSSSFEYVDLETASMRSYRFG